MDFYHRIYFLGKQNGGVKRLLAIYERRDDILSEVESEGEGQNYDQIHGKSRDGGEGDSGSDLESLDERGVGVGVGVEEGSERDDDD